MLLAEFEFPETLVTGLRYDIVSGSNWIEIRHRPHWMKAESKLSKMRRKSSKKEKMPFLALGISVALTDLSGGTLDHPDERKVRVLEQPPTSEKLEKLAHLYLLKHFPEPDICRLLGARPGCLKTIFGATLSAASLYKVFKDYPDLRKSAIQLSEDLTSLAQILRNWSIKVFALQLKENKEIESHPISLDIELD